MKQLLLIVIIAASALTVSAQKDYRNDRNDDRYHYKYDGKVRDLNDRGNYPRNKREYKRQVSIINRDYDSRIGYIRNHPRMRRMEKSRQIEALEMQRRIALDQCKDRYMHRDYAERRKW